ncbi:MAG: MFS transporter [Treponema sp.]|jgi:MFS family permease|nr:MFS transporter [Treponema sp.]
MTSQLSPYRQGKAREVYNYFNILNSISWNLLVGIIITLFAMRLGASSTYIGLLGSSFYVALFLLPLGKLLARRFSIIGIYSFTWVMRSICMVMAAAAPFFDLAGHRNTALLFILIGVFSFHLFRGIGMIGNNPVLSQLAAGPDRGSYLTQIQIMNSAIGMFGSFLMAMVLGMEPPVFVYSILLSIGVITGIVSGYMIRKVPEPPGEEDGRGMKLHAIFKDALAQDGLRRFMIIFFLVAMVSGVTRIFAVVYAREVFAHSDGLVSLYTVFGGLGFLMVGLSIKFLVDRIGAKPLFIVCVIIGLVSMIPVVFFPRSAVENMTGAILFLSFLFFMLNFGFLGSEGIAQTYFMALIPQEKMLDLGILYFMIFGAAGASGSFLAGLLLDLFRVLGISFFVSFKILFISQIALTLAALFLQKGLKSLGSLSLKGALEVIFSIRDLRAISLLDKLNNAQDSKEEEILLGELHNTPSQLSIKGLLERARSPRMITRLESIRALEKLHNLSDDAERALVDDIKNNPFTTAYISARILGNHGCTGAIPLLRELASSTDYMLAGEAIIALAKMKDETFRPQIEKIILDTQNPRLKIMGAEALGLYRRADSLSVLLEILRGLENPHGADPMPYLKDEVVLAMAEILGTQRQFYRILDRYVANNSLAVTLGMDEAEAALEFCKSIFGKRKSTHGISSHVETFHAVVSEYVKNKNGTELSRWILEFPGEGGSAVKSMLSEAVIDDALCVHDGLRLLIIHWAAYQLRVWAAKAV